MSEQAFTTSKLPKYCQDCIYKSNSGQVQTCDYILLTGHMRPCPVVGCTVKQIGAGPKKKGKAPSRDMEKGLELYEQGLNSREIADAVGTTPSAVRAWAHRLGLNWSREPEPQKQEAPPEPGPPPEEEPAPEREAEEERDPMVRTILSWGGCEVYAAGELRAVIDLLIRLEGAG